MSAPDNYGLMAEFGDEHALLAAVKSVRERHSRVEAYSPYPVDGLNDALGYGSDHIPLIVLLGALFGGVGTFAMEMYSAVIDYPINVGGRPANSWPAFIPPAMEMTALFAVLFGVFGLLALNRLPRLYHPVFNVDAFERASNDRFFLVVRAEDDAYDGEDTRAFLEQLDPAPLSVAEVCS